MNIIVIRGTGLIGSMLVHELAARGHEAVPAALDTGVNTLTPDSGYLRAKAAQEKLITLLPAAAGVDKADRRRKGQTATG
jgi:uncharacterized protein YbjT (DUF2867 family)